MRPFDWILILIIAWNMIRLVVGAFTIPEIAWVLPTSHSQIIKQLGRRALWVVGPVLLLVYRLWG